MSDIEFVNGLIAKAPRDTAPEFVKASLSIKREELIAWLQEREGEWINVDIKEGRTGKWYAAVDAWKPNSERAESSAPRQQRAPAPAPAGDFQDDDIPF